MNEPTYLLSGFIKTAQYTDPNNKRKPIRLTLTNGMTLMVTSEQLEDLPRNLEKQPLLTLCSRSFIRKNTYVAQKLFPITELVDDFSKVAKELEANTDHAWKLYSKMTEKEKQIWMHSLKATGYGSISIGGVIAAVVNPGAAFFFAGTALLSTLAMLNEIDKAKSCFSELEVMIKQHQTNYTQYICLLKIAGVPEEYINLPNVTPKLWFSSSVLGLILGQPKTKADDLNIDFDMVGAFV